MRRLLLLLAAACCGLLAAGAAAQQGPFTVAEIRITGLDKVEESTVLAFVSFGPGDEISPAELAGTVARLFETGLFRDVEVMREGNVVVIDVSENPIISAIRFEGLAAINEDTLLDLLKGQGIAVGRIFKRGSNEFIESAIRSLYRRQSRFLASARLVTVPLEDGRIDLVVEISEGPQATIREINFHGNEVFTVDELRGFFELKQESFVDSLLDRDVYDPSVLAGDLDRVRREYLNAGYIRFEVLSRDVKVIPDEGAIVIDVFLNEGSQYRFGETFFEIEGDSISEERAMGAVDYEPGQVFADRLVDRTRDSLRRVLRRDGFAFATAEYETAIDDDALVVAITYRLSNDRLAEIRSINFIGNNLTQDLVLRRQLEIVEGETFDIDKLEYSLTRLRRSGYLREVKASERRVGDDQVDIDIEVVEVAQGRLVVGAGYSNSDGVSFAFDFARNNIFGSGNDFALKFETKDSGQDLDLTFREPGITDSGITRLLNLYISDSDGELTSSSAINDLGGRLVYTIPIDREWSWNAGMVAEQSRISNHENLLSSSTLPVIREFVTRYEGEQNSLRLVSGIGYDSRDTAFDTTEGLLFNVNAEYSLPGSDSQYYTTGMRGTYYAPLDDRRLNIISGEFDFKAGGEIGDAIFPYYKRFFISSGQLRGFRTTRLGPVENGSEIGGRFLAHGSVEVLRNLRLFDLDGVRAGAFMDAAGLWEDYDAFIDNSDEMRASVGAVLKIRTPLFPLSFTYAYPVVKEEEDALRRFQFNLGF
ncbi:MAG: outer membrane protein assembly factor BamA [Betaproteobacteria bacterium AqS2]|uniref:Outer membrane protein assembly factor BamA n=1 Tax=Candidatus Amphirhobacter heronislandensis TaxID=1732024 RepID=A0A930UHN7_9GAMM|nr:outer membrane protein assembly factor BamA [Betaproteobacteria bacterium AqS2]